MHRSSGVAVNAEMARPLQQQFAHGQRARRLLPGGSRLCRRVMLHLAHDRLARDRHAVDADRHRRRRRLYGGGIDDQVMAYSAGTGALRRARRVRTT